MRRNIHQGLRLNHFPREGGLFFYLFLIWSISDSLANGAKGVWTGWDQGAMAMARVKAMAPLVSRNLKVQRRGEVWAWLKDKGTRKGLGPWPLPTFTRPWLGSFQFDHFSSRSSLSLQIDFSNWSFFQYFFVANLSLFHSMSSNFQVGRFFDDPSVPGRHTHRLLQLQSDRRVGVGRANVSTQLPDFRFVKGVFLILSSKTHRGQTRREETIHHRDKPPLRQTTIETNHHRDKPPSRRDETITKAQETVKNFELILGPDFSHVFSFLLPSGSPPDVGMHINTAFFATTGKCGYVRRPGYVTRRVEMAAAATDRRPIEWHITVC